MDSATVGVTMSSQTLSISTKVAYYSCKPLFVAALSIPSIMAPLMLSLIPTFL